MMEDQNDNPILEEETMEDSTRAKSGSDTRKSCDLILEKPQEIVMELREIKMGIGSSDVDTQYSLETFKTKEIGAIGKTVKIVSNNSLASNATLCQDSSMIEKELLASMKKKKNIEPLLFKALGYQKTPEDSITDAGEMSKSLCPKNQSVDDEIGGCMETPEDPRLQEAENDDDHVENETIDDEVDAPQVGIVGLPTTVRDIFIEEELGTTASSSLPSDNKNNDNRTMKSSSNGGAPNVVEWIKRSKRSNDPDSIVETNKSLVKPTLRRRKRSSTVDNMAIGAATVGPMRKSQRIVTSIIRRSIKCLNKMHAPVEFGSGSTNVKKLESTTEKRQEDARDSPKVAQNRQNGAALPEETATAIVTSANVTNATERLCPTIKRENNSDEETERQTMPIDSSARAVQCSVDEIKDKTCEPIVPIAKSGRDKTRKRRSTDYTLGANCTGENEQFLKKICFEQRERFIDSLVGNTERVTANELASRADQLRVQVQALDELARAKEMEWNEILSMRKLKEEAYLRIERRRQVVGFMDSNSNGQLDSLPLTSLALVPEWESAALSTGGNLCGDRKNLSGEEQVPSPETQESQQKQQQQQLQLERSPSHPSCDKTINSQQRRTLPKQLSENGRKTQQQQVCEQQSLDNRQIGEGRQGPIVDVRSIIADYRLRHPETIPRRGRRMRNSVNVGLGAGGAMVETGHNADSRPSSTDSCKSNPNPSLAYTNNSMSFKDVLVQFAKLSQQQGEPVKTPQNYPDVTLHPVAPSPVVLNSTMGSTHTSTGSLLHGILTKSQSPRPTTFSPTLARLLTAPERERNSSGSASSIAATSTPQNRAVEQTQHLLHTYQGSNPVSISDLLSSSKARTEITITPVVNPVTPINTSQSSTLIHVDDVEEDASVIDEGDSRLGSGARENRDERDSPPRCQGCQERAAQFVCAGCGNQWYCSRDCQVAAWDEHSEVCSG